MRDRGIRAEMLWVSPPVGHEMYRMALDDPHAGPRMMSVDSWTREMVGLTLNIDDCLAGDVWRLADEHGTLLYDCREGKPVP